MGIPVATYRSPWPTYPCVNCTWAGYTPNHHAYRPIKRYCRHDPPPAGLLESNGCREGEARESWDLVVEEQGTCGYWESNGYDQEDDQEDD